MSKQSDKILIKKLFLKAKIYRILTLIAIVLGVSLFVFLYQRGVEGRLIQALREPVTVLILIFPFLPAIILSWLSGRVEKELKEKVGSS